MRGALTGAVLVCIYTAFISSADAITKLIAGGYAAPQMFCLSGLLVAGLCVCFSKGRELQTSCPRAMSFRAAATVLAALSFFYAFRLLPFADVFLFIGLMPLFAGVMSGLILKEHVRMSAWIALASGFVGVLCLFPQGLQELGAGHAWALAASVFGTFSMIMARYIGRVEQNALAQVFYPNLALFVVMGLALPYVWQPMNSADIAWVAVYAALLFVARWVLVVALRLLAAYAVTPLMNLQFVWMVILGAVFFGEWPTASTLLGVAIVMSSGVYLVWDQITPKKPDAARYDRGLELQRSGLDRE